MLTEVTRLRIAYRHPVFLRHSVFPFPPYFNSTQETLMKKLVKTAARKAAGVLALPEAHPAPAQRIQWGTPARA